jgi:hypothetical protein
MSLIAYFHPRNIRSLQITLPFFLPLARWRERGSGGEGGGALVGAGFVLDFLQNPQLLGSPSPAGGSKGRGG